nr:hypothetical protein [Tanacetum cinerariifolium]
MVMVNGPIQRLRRLHDDPLVDVVVHVDDDDDDDDDGNSRAHKINDEVRPKKKAKTSRVTMDDLMVGMQSGLRHIVRTTDGQTTKQCYEKPKLVRLRLTDPVFLAAFNIFRQSRQILRQIFKGAVGALDGNLIHACVPINKQHLYRGRGNGDCYQNVSAISDFNMMFTFLVAGWEGVAYDSRNLSEAIRNQNASFPLPPPELDDLCFFVDLEWSSSLVLFSPSASEAIAWPAEGTPLVVAADAFSTTVAKPVQGLSKLV